MCASLLIVNSSMRSILIRLTKKRGEEKKHQVDRCRGSASSTYSRTGLDAAADALTKQLNDITLLFFCSFAVCSAGLDWFIGSMAALTEP